MKETYRPKSKKYYFIILGYLFISIAAVVVLIIFKDKFLKMESAEGWLLIFCCIVTPICSIYVIIQYYKIKIVFHQDRIHILEDIGIGTKKLKKYLKKEYLFDEISGIILDVYSENPLKDKTSLLRKPKICVIVQFKDDDEGSFSIFYYNKKQIIEIVDLLIKKIKLVDPDFMNLSGKKMMESLQEKYLSL